MQDNEDPRWQAELRSKIEQLRESLYTHSYNAWETEFIESLSERLGNEPIVVSEKQWDKLYELWEKL